MYTKQVPQAAIFRYRAQSASIRRVPKMMAKLSPKAHCTFTDVHKTGPDQLHLPISHVFWTPKTSWAFASVHKTGPDSLHLPISWHPTQGPSQDVTNRDFWSPLHNSPFGAIISVRAYTYFFAPRCCRCHFWIVHNHILSRKNPEQKTFMKKSWF